MKWDRVKVKLSDEKRIASCVMNFIDYVCGDYRIEQGHDMENHYDLLYRGKWLDTFESLKEAKAAAEELEGT